MELKKLKARIEAILFAMGKSVRLTAIAEAVELDEDTVRKVMYLKNIISQMLCLKPFQ